MITPAELAGINEVIVIVSAIPSLAGGTDSEDVSDEKGVITDDDEVNENEDRIAGVGDDDEE